MGRHLVGTLVLVLVGCASIAGLEGADREPETKPASNATSVVGDAGEEGAAAEPPEQHVSTFACGSTTCIVGQHACCVQGASLMCAGIDAGCPAPSPAADGAAPAPAGPSLACTSYNNCNDDDECCYDPQTGSVCRSECSQGQARLCQLSSDRCGEERDCRSMTNPPLAGVGECVRSGGGGGGGGWGGGGGGGWP